MLVHGVFAVMACYCGAAAQSSDRSNFKEMTKERSKNVFITDNIITEDREVVAELTTGNVSSFSYLHGTYSALTLVIRPCTSAINISIYHIHQNNSGPLKHLVQGRSGTLVARGSGTDPYVFTRAEAPPGLYLFHLVAEHRNATVTMYATSLPGVPPALTIVQSPKVYIQQRLHRNRVTLRWAQSVIDPQYLRYYVAVNSRRNFSSLCQADYATGMNVYTTDHANVRQRLGMDDVFVTYVGSKLSYTISNLEKGRDYYFNVFARNRNSQLSFLYANKYFKYQPSVRPVGLRDNKPMTVNIQRFGGKALFRYKVSKSYNSSNDSSISWHIMPCGGTLQAQVTMMRQVVVPWQTVEGYQHIRIPSPTPGMRYVLTLSVTDPWQLKQIQGVEVLATMKLSPLPSLPVQATVYEYYGMRTCTSVTVGWEPVTAQTVMYCVYASPVASIDADYYFRKRPNQCNLDNRSQLHSAKGKCQLFSPNDERQVLIETITKLRPGKEYLIQVTVKKIKGKALSYDLLRVNTKSKCSDEARN